MDGELSWVGIRGQIKQFRGALRNYAKHSTANCRFDSTGNRLFFLVSQQAVPLPTATATTNTNSTATTATVDSTANATAPAHHTLAVARLPFLHDQEQQGAVPSPANPYSWSLLLAPQPADPLSTQELLLRERRRCSINGITSFLISKHDRILFQSNSSIFYVDPLPDITALLEPVEVPTESPGVRMDPKFCPSSSDRISFVRDRDLWCIDVMSGIEKRLTFVGGSSTHTLSAGYAEFVMQEEFNRYSGYWWAPPTNVDSDHPRHYHILYLEVDESKVELVKIQQSSGIGEPDLYRYPRAGNANAASIVKIVRFDMESAESPPKSHVLSFDLKAKFPSYEYIVRCGWMPSGDAVWLQLLDRAQEEMVVVEIHLSEFLHVDTAQPLLPRLREDYLHVNELLTEKSQIWVNVNDLFTVLSDSAQYDVSWLHRSRRFIWASERTGFRHLYLYQQTYDVELHTLSSSCLPLTAGDWQVDSEQLWVDEKRKFLYFIGSLDSPLFRHLYRVSFDTEIDSTSRSVQRLTEGDFSHQIEMDDHCSNFVTLFSNIYSPASMNVYALDGVSEPTWRYHVLHASLPLYYNAPELFHFQVSPSVTLHGCLYKPAVENFDPQRKYPVIVYVYGGPQVQMVSNECKALAHSRQNELAMFGFCVLSIDGRGSTRRGLQFEGHIKQRLGQVEIYDQVAGLDYACSKYKFMDRSRVSLYGWSYGGYISLLGLCQRPDVFKIAVSGAPVTDWKLYDTGYTERYLGLPAEQSVAYRHGSVLNYVNSLPLMPNRLLLVHGALDENVHLAHTMQLVQRLVNNGVPYQLQIYPSERHGIRQAAGSVHHVTSLVHFLMTHL